MNRDSVAGSLSPSLPEVHGSVGTGQASIWRRMFAFAGPAYLVSVGYMDPGNWATDIEGGARFGYELLWVLVMSNLMAILLQTLSARLGIASSRDLAQACRESYPRAVNFALWVLCEIAIAACDLAEVLGAAIGLNLLFGLPLLPGVLLTSLDILMLLWMSRLGIRVIEGFVLSLIAVMAGCFLLEIMMAKPAFSEIATGLVPRLNNQNLYLAIAILGATVMPHNLYLHSALVQTRRIGTSDKEKRTACRFNLIDSVVALNGALLVNAAILVLAGAVFFKRHIVVTEIQQAYQMLTPLLGTAFASILFGVALRCSGQSSTMTGTMAGQIVMEGFLTIRMRPWLRRLTTRTVAIVPAAITIYIAGEGGTLRLLILSQVILSMQLPFAVIPLIHFTNDKARMGTFANRAWVKVLAWVTAVVIIGLNVRLVYMTIGEWLEAAGPNRDLVIMLVEPILIGLLVLLAWMIFEPWLFKRKRLARTEWAEPPVAPAAPSNLEYRNILVPLDHTGRDRGAIAHAAALAKTYGAKLYLLHVEEGVTSQIYGSQASTAEVQAGERYLDSIVEKLRAQGIDVEATIAHARDPKQEIVRFAQQIHAGLLVMGAHGHKGIQDIVFGQTINGVRHDLDIPLLIVKNEGSGGGN